MSAEVLSDAPMPVPAGFTEPEPMALLKSRTASIRVPAWMPVSMGVVFVNEARGLSLGAPDLTRQMLAQLALGVSLRA